jgi:hypothetical protein
MRRPSGRRLACLVRAMGRPAPLVLALLLAPELIGLHWAIGGSTLLYSLGIEKAPRDLDIVTTPEHFDALDERLTRNVGLGFRPEHETYRSDHFNRFTSCSGVTVDVMAGINVLVGGRNICWDFDPQRIVQRDGLPWMSAQDWLDLYKLFQRTTRVAQLNEFLIASTTDEQQSP